MGVVTNAQLGNFTADGAYVANVPPQPVISPGPQSNLFAVVGPASWGLIGVAQPFSDYKSGQFLYGSNTTLTNSLMREALNAMPQCNNFLGVRVTDGTDIASKILILDTATPTPATVLTLTAKSTGSYGNLASARVDLQSGTMAVGPVLQITVYFPNAQPQVFSNIIGSTTTGGPYAPATFVANAIAKINGTGPNGNASPFFVATAGTSIIAPVLGTVFNASGGTDGASGVLTALLLGTDGISSRTGLYALRGSVAGAQVAIAGLSDPVAFAPLAAFCRAEGAQGWFAIPSGNPTSQAVAYKSVNNLTDDNMFVATDWDYVYDNFAQAQIQVSPIGKLAGIVCGQPAWQYCGNKPINGIEGGWATEQTIRGELSIAEAGQRTANGIMWLGDTPRGPMGLPHGMTSSGKLGSDIRMFNYEAVIVQGILNNIVGDMQSPTDPNDQTRDEAAGALEAVFELQKSSHQIADYNVVVNTTDNTTITVEEGFLIADGYVLTLSGVRFALANLQVGNTVNIPAAPVGG